MMSCAESLALPRAGRLQYIVSLLLSLKCPLPNEMVDLDDVGGGREGRLGCTLDRFQSGALVDMSLKEVEGGCSSNY